MLKFTGAHLGGGTQVPLHQQHVNSVLINFPIEKHGCTHKKATGWDFSTQGCCNCYFGFPERLCWNCVAGLKPEPLCLSLFEWVFAFYMHHLNCIQTERKRMRNENFLRCLPFILWSFSLSLSLLLGVNRPLAVTRQDHLVDYNPSPSRIRNPVAGKFW